MKSVQFKFTNLSYGDLSLAMRNIENEQVLMDYNEFNITVTAKERKA